MPERSPLPLKAPPRIAWPAIAWLSWFLLVPLGIVAVYSFATKGVYGGIVYDFSFQNYVRATDWLYLKIFIGSLKLAFLTAASCLVIGFPVAYVIATSSPRMRALLLVLVVVPFWTNFVVRAYAIKVLLSENGPINQLGVQLGLMSEPIFFANSDLAVWLGMVTNYLPFMVLPLYVSLEKFDFSLLEAAKDLGAPAWKVLTRILLPLTRPGIVTGTLFVFTPALGEFVIPDMLGGARTTLVGNLITDQFLRTRDWPFGAALSLLLITVVVLSLLIYIKMAHESPRVSR